MMKCRVHINLSHSLTRTKGEREERAKMNNEEWIKWSQTLQIRSVQTDFIVELTIECAFSKGSLWTSRWNQDSNNLSRLFGEDNLF